MRTLAAAALMLLVVSCSSAPPGPLAVKDMPAINTNAVLDDIRKLSSDEFEGRQPGTKGEQLTVSYVTDRFKDAGVEPGNPDGSWTQKVPLVGLKPSKFSPLTLKKGGQTLSFKQHDDVIAFTQRVTDSIAVKDSDVVFAGYGVQAPEYNWDDFKGVDVKGKTIIVLVNDPPVPDPANPSQLDPKTFGGKAMTLLRPLDLQVRQGRGARRRRDVHRARDAVRRVSAGTSCRASAASGSISSRRTRTWAARRSRAGSRSMRRRSSSRPRASTSRRSRRRPARATSSRCRSSMAASMSFTQTLRTVESQNVIAKITGADPRSRTSTSSTPRTGITLGVGTPVNGDNIYNGARDNASGTAMLIEFAREFKKVQPAPKRTILFLAVTSEEQGLLGSEYYAKFPLYPLNKTLAEHQHGRDQRLGQDERHHRDRPRASDLDDYAQDAAAEQGRTLTPDAEPEKGFYYRSDHFNFAKVGVPAFDPDSGLHFVGKPANYGQQKRDEWTEKDLPPAVGSDEGLVGSERRGRGRPAALRDRLPRRERRRVPAVEARQRVQGRARQVDGGRKLGAVNGSRVPGPRVPGFDEPVIESAVVWHGH